MCTIFKTSKTWRGTHPKVKTGNLKVITIGIFLCLIGKSVAVPVEREMPSSGSSGTLDENICQAKGCREIANTFIKNMDRSVDPCDNFYKFACGGFINSTVIPGDQGSVSTWSLLEDNVQAQLRTIIEAPIQPNEVKPFRLAKNFYKTCIDVDEIEAQGMQPLRDILDKLGGWPVADGERSKNDNFDWTSSITQILEAGYEISYLMSIITFPDVKNNTKNSIYIDQQTFGLSKNYLTKGFNDSVVQAYYSYMVDIAVIFGAERHRAVTELEEALRFEMKLSNMSMTLKDRQNVTKSYNPMTVSELKKNYSSIPWDTYLSKILPSTETIADNEVVIVSDPNYIAGLENLMATTPKRVQANYVMWRIVAASVRYMNEIIRARLFAYKTVVQGVTEREPRWKECLDEVSSQLPVSVGAMYARNYFNEGAKENAAITFENIKDQFKKTLEQVDWMDSETRQRALHKLARMSSNVGFPDELLDDNKLEEYYNNLELSVGNYLKSFLNITLFNTKKSFGNLHKPAIKNDWTMQNPSSVNAFYAYIYNSIELPAAVLQGVFFGNDRPKYMNYGAIGFFVGHEITHGFDEMGNQFDHEGNAINWWAQLTKDRFADRTKCMVQQYGNYTVDEVGLNLNGEQILNEVIADNGGIKEAYLAYINWASRNSPEHRLPGLSYTPNQMFWISAANTWCTKYTTSELIDTITTDDHSPGEFRVIGPLSNMPEFSKDFNCPIGSKMNPLQKCSVW